MKMKKICTVCKDVELTDEEAAQPKTLCYWCLVDLHVQAAKIMGTDLSMISLPNPALYGRTVEEVDGGRPSEEERETTAKHTPVNKPDNRAGFIPNPKLPDFTPEAKKLLKSLDFDPDNPPPLTVIEARGLEGVVLRLEITAKMKPEWVDAFQKILERDLESYVRALAFGTKHKAVLADITEHLNNKGNPQGPFPFMG